MNYYNYYIHRYYDLKSLAGILLKNRTVDNWGSSFLVKNKSLKYEKIQKEIIQSKYNYSDTEYRSINVGGEGSLSNYPKI